MGKMVTDLPWYEGSLRPDHCAQLAILGGKRLGTAGETDVAEWVLHDLEEPCRYIRRSLLVPYTEHLPFDLLLNADGEFWLVEVKTQHDGWGLPSETQKRRMTRLCEIIENGGHRVIPLLLQLCASQAKWVLRDFPQEALPSERNGDLQGIADKVVKWIQTHS